MADKNIDEFSELVQEFCANLKITIKEITHLLEKLKVNADAAFLQLLYQKVHGLVGTSAMFGYNTISLKLKEIQNLVFPMLNQTLSTAQLVTLEKLLNELNTIIKNTDFTKPSNLAF